MMEDDQQQDQNTLVEELTPACESAPRVDKYRERYTEPKHCHSPCIKNAKTTFRPRCNLSSVCDPTICLDSMAVVDVIGYSPPTPIPYMNCEMLRIRLARRHELVKTYP